METIAVYWEAVIRIYGFIVTSGLAMINFRVDNAAGLDAPEAAACLEKCGPLRFAAAVGVDVAAGGFEQLILTDADQVAPARAFIEARYGAKASQRLTVTAPVDLMAFQGPHFGDRYGIAEAAFTAVAKAGVPLLASGLSSATVYLVFPGGTAGRVKRRLAEAFTVPEGP